MTTNDEPLAWRKLATRSTLGVNLVAVAVVVLWCVGAPGAKMEEYFYVLLMTILLLGCLAISAAMRPGWKNLVLFTILWAIGYGGFWFGFVREYGYGLGGVEGIRWGAGFLGPSVAILAVINLISWRLDQGETQISAESGDP